MRKVYFEPNKCFIFKPLSFMQALCNFVVSGKPVLLWTKVGGDFLWRRTAEMG